MATLDDRVLSLEKQLAQTKEDYNESLDTIWMLLAALLVFFMHAGFSLLEAGSVRFKNTQNILAKNLIVVTLGFLCWYAWGYALALGVPETGAATQFGGNAGYFMNNFWGAKSSFRGWFFQGAFCATGATIVSGAMAERTQLKGFATFTIVLTSVIYPIVVYWGWSGEGFLNYTKDGESVSLIGPALIDFAGSGIVHLVGGVAALCGAIAVGPRQGRFEADASGFDAHSIPFCVLGTFCLWFGWYGFNPGSTGSMHDKGTANTAGLVAVNTTLAPCAAGLLVFLLRAKIVEPRLLDVGGFCNGILAGLVSITAGCAAVEPWEAILIGLFGGAFYQGASMLLKKVRVDDVVDAVPVHGACGIWGIVALGFFGNPASGIGGNGLFYGGSQIGTQIFAGLAIILWTGALSLLIFLPLRKLGFLRLSDEFQETGADMMEHSPRKAYSDDKTDTQKVAEEKKEAEEPQDTFDV
jgi:Amt family ammonium transporter